jgi:hypothetical protein
MLHSGMESSQVDYYKVADLVWSGMTIPEAVRELGYEWKQHCVPIEVKRYLVDVSMLANAREEFLGALLDAD